MTAQQQDTRDHGTGPDAVRELVDRVDRYCDSAPRGGGRAEDFGALTLFVREDGGGPYYARPKPGAALPPSRAEVDAVLARQRELGVPEAFEWLGATAPGLRGLLEQAGLTVGEHPLLALPLSAPVAAGETPTVRLVGAEDPALAQVIAAQYLGFGTPDTAVGTVSVDALAAEAEARSADGTVARARARITAGLTAFAAAFDGDLPVAAGQHNPVGGTSEIVGVATLPAFRRQGLGLAVTAALLADARGRGTGTVFLSASDADVARVYERAGFRPIGTALTAEI